MRHNFVPKHTIMGDKEKEELLKHYNISIKQLPKILKNDPVVKILKAKQGDIIKIIRKSPTTGESTYYRVVVNA